MRMVLITTMILVGNLFAQENTSTTSEFPSDEMNVVAGIFEESGLKAGNIKDRVKIRDGHVVELDMSNKVVSKMGIRKLSLRIGELIYLENLNLADNTLDSLPESIGGCSQLKVLNLANNDIRDLPWGLCRLKNLEHLDLRYNEIRIFPTCIDNCLKIKYLHLWGNRLESLPAEVGNLPELKELYLKGNRLTSLPISLTKSKSIVYLDFQDNKLCNVEPEIDTWLKKFDPKYLSRQRCLSY